MLLKLMIHLKDHSEVSHKAFILFCFKPFCWVTTTPSSKESQPFQRQTWMLSHKDSLHGQISLEGRMDEGSWGLWGPHRRDRHTWGHLAGAEGFWKSGMGLSKRGLGHTCPGGGDLTCIKRRTEFHRKYTLHEK